MKTVYLVWSGEGQDRNVDRIYATYEAAQHYADRMNTPRPVVLGQDTGAPLACWIEAWEVRP